MILTAQAIFYQLAEGNLVIDPLDDITKRVNPNSVNLRLDPTLLVYDEVVLDARKENRHQEIIIPDGGLVLEPGQLYLGKTFEYTETHRHVPRIDGRSSIGRLGIFVHVTAGFGDIGFCGNWTLEITVVHSVRVYPMMELCQISYHDVSGPITSTYKGKYQGERGVQPSKLWQESPRSG